MRQFTALRSAFRSPGRPQQRLLAWATLVNTVGTGVYLSAGMIFLIRSAGLTPIEVGLGLTAGSMFGVVAGVVIGDQADRRDSRKMLIACMLIQAVGSVSLLLVHSALSLGIASAVAATGRAGAGSSRGALIGAIAEEGKGAQLRTYLRALTNVGLALGAVESAIVLAIDTRGAYIVMILTDTVTFLAAAVILTRLSSAPPAHSGVARPDRRWLALRDKPYLALTVASSIAALQYWVLIQALPVWVSQHTEAPRWLAAALFFMAAAIVAIIQVPATRSIRDPRSAARLLALSGPLFLLAWTMIAESSGRAVAVAIVLLVAGVAVHSIGEVWQAGGAFELTFALAPPEALGQYQGVVGLGFGLAESAAPSIVLPLCLTWGKPGWIVLAVIVMTASFVCLAVEKLASAHRAGVVAPPDTVSGAVE